MTSQAETSNQDSKTSRTYSKFSWTIATVVTLFLTAAIIYEFFVVVEEKQTGIFLLCFTIAIILMTALSAYEKYKLLIKGWANNVDMKFRAEVWAGCALFSFIVPFMQLAPVLDHATPADRVTRLTEIIAENKALADCVSIPNESLCKALNADLLEFKILLAAKAGQQDVSRTLSEIKDDLENLRRAAKAPEIQIRVGSFVNKIREPAWSDSQWMRALQLLPAVTLMFASYAVSSKIAIARYDLAKSKRADPKPQTPRPIENINVETTINVASSTVMFAAGLMAAATWAALRSRTGKTPRSDG